MEAATTPDALLSELDRLDVRLWADGDRLRYDAPAGALTSELRELLRSHKGELLDLLRERGAPERRRRAPYDAAPSFVQRHFWALQQRHPTACFYNVPYAFRLRGALDVPRLRDSLDALVRRHDLLRTTLQVLDGELRQVVSATGRVPLTTVDLRGVPAADREDEVDRLVGEELATPFDLAREPCLRARLWQLADDEHVLFVCVHSVMGEDGSIAAFLRDLTAHYRGPAGPPGHIPTPVPELPLQYADYARWQQSLLTGDQEARLAYWRQWFAKGAPPAVTPGLSRPGADLGPTFGAGMVWHRYPASLTAPLKRLSGEAGVTLFMTAIAGYAALLYRYSGCTDIVVGGPASNRSHWKLEPLIGSTLNIVAYRFDLGGNPDVRSLLGRVRETVVSSLAHQDVPFAALAPHLGPVAQVPPGPLFRTVLTFSEDTPHGHLELPGVAVTFLERITNREVLPDLFPVMWEDGDGGLTSYWLYREALFDRTTIVKMVDDYGNLLRSFADNPMRTIDSLPLPGS